MCTSFTCSKYYGRTDAYRAASEDTLLKIRGTSLPRSRLTQFTRQFRWRRSAPDRKQGKQNDLPQTFGSTTIKAVDLGDQRSTRKRRSFPLPRVPEAVYFPVIRNITWQEGPTPRRSIVRFAKAHHAVSQPASDVESVIHPGRLQRSKFPRPELYLPGKADRSAYRPTVWAIKLPAENSHSLTASTCFRGTFEFQRTPPWRLYECKRHTTSVKCRNTIFMGLPR